RLACWLRLRTFRASSCMRIWSVRGSSWRTSSAGAFALQDEGRASNATSQRIRQLERELARKEKALGEAAALLVLKKDREGSSRRGRRRRRAERELIPTGIGKARSSGARLSAACKIAGISARTIERWRSAPHADDRRCGPHRRPANALSPTERATSIPRAWCCTPTTASRCAPVRSSPRCNGLESYRP